MHGKESKIKFEIITHKYTNIILIHFSFVKLYKNEQSKLNNSLVYIFMHIYEFLEYFFSTVGSKCILQNMVSWKT